MPGEEDDEEPDQLVVRGWELTDLNKEGVSIELDFGDPLKISSKDEPDLLLV